jgi:putative PIN family toxin of toxin-antitoxin system
MTTHAVLSVVLDSNVLISLLVFEDPRYPRIAAGWRDGRLCVLKDEPCAAEFRRVLAYPRLKLAGERQAAIYAEFEKCARMVAPGGGREGGAALPLCADADDQKFLELAARSGADCLVTGDGELLRLARRVPFAILTADELEQRLAG